MANLLKKQTNGRTYHFLLVRCRSGEKPQNVGAKGRHQATRKSELQLWAEIHVYMLKYCVCICLTCKSCNQICMIDDIYIYTGGAQPSTKPKQPDFFSLLNGCNVLT